MMYSSLTSDQGCMFKPQLCLMSFVKIDTEIISTVILPLWLVQEGHLSATGESMCIKYWLTTYRIKPA